LNLVEPIAKRFDAIIGAVIRAMYVIQKMDQLRNRTSLTLAAPPASIPDSSLVAASNATLDCRLRTLSGLPASKLIQGAPISITEG
jgi:hypothetical protein